MSGTSRERPGDAGKEPSTHLLTEQFNACFASCACCRSPQPVLGWRASATVCPAAATAPGPSTGPLSLPQPCRGASSPGDSRAGTGLSIGMGTGMGTGIGTVMGTGMGTGMGTELGTVMGTGMGTGIGPGWAPGWVLGWIPSWAPGQDRSGHQDRYQASACCLSRHAGFQS